MSALVGALFFVRQGREAAFTTLPPLFVRHPPLHREGYNKVTPSAAGPPRRARGTSLSEGGTEIARSTDFYSLSHGVGFQPNAVTAPRRGAYNEVTPSAPTGHLPQRGRQGDIDCFTETREARKDGKLRHLLPPSQHRSKLRMPRHLPEEEAIIRRRRGRGRLSPSYPYRDSGSCRGGRRRGRSPPLPLFVCTSDRAPRFPRR